MLTARDVPQMLVVVYTHSLRPLPNEDVYQKHVYTFVSQLHVYIHMYMYVCMYMKKSSMQCQKKEGTSPGHLFQAFGPHQQGAAKYLPGTTGP